MVRARDKATVDMGGFTKSRKGAGHALPADDLGTPLGQKALHWLAWCSQRRAVSMAGCGMECSAYGDTPGAGSAVLGVTVAD
jgi:hypothetical protein